MKRRLIAPLAILLFLLPQGASAAQETSPLFETPIQGVDPIEQDSRAINRSVVYTYSLPTYIVNSVFYDEYIGGVYHCGILRKTRVVKVNGQYHVTYTGYISPKS